MGTAGLTLADNLAYERALHDQGLQLIAGVDEVGRGALAGPLVSAAVVLPPLEQIAVDWDFWAMVRDSKVVQPRERAELAAAIEHRARSVGIAAVDPEEIDAIGLTAANRSAMERAILALDVEPEMLLIDALTIDSGIPQIGIVDGDAISLAIAAASIVAKVTRDAIMVRHDPTYPVYGFAGHKGYGVPGHLAALREHGPCRLHRRSFAPVRAMVSHATP